MFRDAGIQTLLQSSQKDHIGLCLGEKGGGVRSIAAKIASNTEQIITPDCASSHIFGEEFHTYG